MYSIFPTALISMTLYNLPQEADGISFFAKGSCHIDLQLYDLAL